jgi:predicted transcriptional regulator
VGHIVIYATKPIKQIVGFFKVNKISEGAPGEIWEKYRSMGGIKIEDFIKYYTDTSSAVAIEIDDLHILNNPVPLKSISENLAPPQSYSYLPKELFMKLINIEKRTVKISPNNSSNELLNL